MSWETKPLLLKNGLPIPQQFDPALDAWVEYDNVDIKALKTDLALVKTELQAIKTNQLSGDQKVQLSGTIVAHVLNNAQTVAPGANSTEVLASTYIDGTEKEVWLSVQSDQPWFFSRVPNLANRMAGYAKTVYPNNKENPPFFPATGATPVYHLGLGGFFDVVSWVEAKAVALPPKGGAISVRNQGEVNATMTVTLIRRW